MTTVGSTGFNPYANPYVNGYLNQYATGLNEDFMQQAYFPQDNTYVAQNPMFNLQAMQGQPAQDTFQSSGGRTALGDAAKLAAVAGIGTTAGMYYLGGDKVSPFVDGKIDDKLLKSLEDQKELAENIKKAKLEKIGNIITGTVNNNKPNGAKITVLEDQYKAIEEMARTGKWPEATKTPAGLENINQDLAKKIVERVNKHAKQIEKVGQNVVRTTTLSGSSAELNRLNKIMSKLKDLPADITETEFVKHVKKNAKLYDLAEKSEKEIEKEAKRMFKKGIDGLKADFEGKIESQGKTIETIRKGLREKVTLNDAKTGLAEGTADSVKKAVREFKFKKAGKYGLIAAGVAAVLGFVFGGSKS